MFSNSRILPCFNVKARVLSNTSGWLAVACMIVGASSAMTADVISSPSSERVAVSYGKVPLSFEANQGQTDARVKFLSHGSGYSLALMEGEVVLNLQAGIPGGRPKPSVDTLRMKLVGANRSTAATGAEPLPGVVSYFIGNDPQKWQSGIPTYGKVNYAQVYPGVDLVFYGNQRQLEYDFVVAAGADASRIRWQIDGARPALDTDNILELRAPGGTVRFLAPVAYQVIDGKRCPVAATYTVTDKAVGFRLGHYDRGQPLVIDPVLSYFSYLGGTGNDYIGNSFPEGNGSPSPEPTQAVGIDSQGNLYVAGSTSSTDFPVAGTVFSHTTKLAGQNWAFVSKFSPDGSKLLYSAYFGGSAGGNDAAYALAVDSTGNAYVTGSAGSNEFPVTSGAFQTNCAPNYNANTGSPVASCSINGNGAYSQSAFVLKLNPTGSTLIYSSFLGGYGAAWGTGIAVDSVGQAYVTGVATNSLCGGVVHTYGAQYECFPTTATAAISDIGGGNSDDMAFMSVFNSTGSALVYSTLFGDTEGTVSVNGAGCTIDCGAGTYGTAIALDPSANVYITGYTISAHLLLTQGAFNTTGGGPNPSAPQLLNLPNGYGYVAKFNPVKSGTTSLVYSTYFGGSSTGGGNVGGVAADSGGNAYLAGETLAADFPVTPGAYQAQCDPNEPPTFCNQGFYVAKLNPTGTDLVWATYLGAESNAPLHFLGPVVVDSLQNVYVLGQGTGQLPLGGGSVSTLNGPDTVYVAKFNSTGSQVLLGVTVGGGPGGGGERAGGSAVDASGAIYVGGSTLPGGAFATPGAFQQTQAGGADSFVAKVPGALLFVPMTPCRLVDTRNPTAPFGGPSIAGDTSRSFAIPDGACAVPPTATAYSLNVTVVPRAGLAYLTVWPTGVEQPVVSTLNSDGRVKANAAIVPAGTGGGISVYATDFTDVVLDINGYFEPSTDTAALAFYPLTPCRVADTRNAIGSFGGPSLVGSQTRAFPILSSACNIPSSAQAYSLNFTAVPRAGLGYLSAWPTGQPWPGVSTLNAPPNNPVVANAAIVPAGTNGAINVLGSNNTDVIIDINGYFALASSAPGGQALYTVSPCRVLDTRTSGGLMNGTLPVNITGSSCGIASSAQAFVLNATVVPTGGLGYLTLWPENEAQPLVSTLNADDGAITSNMAIVPTANGSIDAFSTSSTQLILDISGYFAPDSGVAP